MLRKFIAVFISVVLLSAGWWGLTGFPLLAALVPLLWISGSYGDSRREWWAVFGWALLTFAAWNALTIWWIWNATWVGPIAATLASSTMSMIAFMLFHSVSKRAPKALAYTLLVTAWIATEYWYTVGEFSFPWLLFGNTFASTVWAVQWYEYTGIFGGTLWVVICNILIYEAILSKRRAAAMRAVAAILVPVIISLIIYFTYTPPTESVKVTLVQPNVDCYDKFSRGTYGEQERTLFSLASEAPSDVDFIVLPETSLPGYVDEQSVSQAPFVAEMSSLLATSHPQAMIVVGASTMQWYAAGGQSSTARQDAGGNYYDIYNTALGIDSARRVQIHHKSRLVIGVEKTPLPWLFKALDFLIIDLGGTVGQLGVDSRRVVFDNEGRRVGAAICYESIYGDYFGDFVRGGAGTMFVITNDGWWGDTPGYRQHFSFSRLRAVEHRRAIARSANTGISGFISPRGDVGQTLGWDERGTLTDSVAVNHDLTFYTRYGDYIARVAQYVMLLCLLYFVAYRYKRRNHLVK